MAQPLLDFLTGRARAALPFFISGVNRGLGANDILVAVGERFGGIRRQTGLDIIAALRDVIPPERIERLTGPDLPFPIDLHKVAPYRIQSNYKYQITFPTPLEGPPDYLTVVSAVPLSATAIREAGAQLAAEPSYSDRAFFDISPNDVTIITAERNPVTTEP